MIEADLSPGENCPSSRCSRSVHAVVIRFRSLDHVSVMEARTRMAVVQELLPGNSLKKNAGLEGWTASLRATWLHALCRHAV